MTVESTRGAKAIGTCTGRSNIEFWSICRCNIDNRSLVLLFSWTVRDGRVHQMLGKGDVMEGERLCGGGFKVRTVHVPVEQYL